MKLAKGSLVLKQYSDEFLSLIIAKMVELDVLRTKMIPNPVPGRFPRYYGVVNIGTGNVSLVEFATPPDVRKLRKRQRGDLD